MRRDASLKNSLPALHSDPLLTHILHTPASWSTSRAPTLTAFHASFTAIASTPTLATPPAYDADLFTTVHTLLFDPTTAAPSIANIRLLSNRHSQAVFSHAISRRRLELRLAHPRTQPHAAARVQACSIRGAASLILSYRVARLALLTDAEFTWWFCHRCGIRPPTISPTAAARCTPRCRTISAAKPITPSHPLFPLYHHGLHQLTCGCSPLRLRRHNHLARCVANHLSPEGSLEASLVANLHSSLTSQTKVDLVFTSALAEQPTAIDFTVSCPLLPAYLSAATRSPHSIIATRAAEKTKKHAAGSAARGRLFLPWVFTTFGAIGPSDVWHYIDTIYASSAALARLSQTTRHAVATRKADFLATLQATLVRSCFLMLSTHTADRPDTSPPNPPRAPAPAPAADADSSRPTTPEPTPD